MTAQINYVDPNSIMVVNANGKMRQIFTPFIVKVIYQTSTLKIDSSVYVEEVSNNSEYKLIYRIGRYWFPYFVFSINTVY